VTEQTTIFRELRFWVLWTLGTAAAWALVPYGGLWVKNTSLTSWGQLPPLAVALGWNGLALGAVMGLAQWAVWLVQMRLPASWILASAIGAGLGFPLGFALATSAIVWINPPLFTPEVAGVMTLAPPVELATLIGGLVTAGVQWRVFRRVFWTGRLWGGTALWCLGNGLGAMSGFFATRFLGNGVPPIAQSAIVGAALGAVSGGVLLILLSLLPRPTEKDRVLSSQVPP
jgi:hypothetical protein